METAVVSNKMPAKNGFSTSRKVLVIWEDLYGNPDIVYRQNTIVKWGLKYNFTPFTEEKKNRRPMPIRQSEFKRIHMKELNTSASRTFWKNVKHNCYR